MTPVASESPKSSHDILNPTTIDQIQERLKDYESGIRLPYKADGQQLFLPASGITVVAAGTGMGKTTFLLNLLCECLKTSRERFYFVSYEEPAFLLAVKILMILSKHSFDDGDNFNRFIAYFRHHGLRVTNNMPESLRAALDTLRRWTDEGRLYLCDPETTVEKLVEAMQQQNERIGIGIEAGIGVGAVFVDYIQRVRIKSQQQSRYLEVKEISQKLRSMAVELGRPVIVGAQFNKNDANSSVLDSIRESADIGHDAVLVLALKREKKPKSGNTSTNLSVEVAKNRYGPSGTIYKLKVHDPTFHISPQDEQGSASAAQKAFVPTPLDVKPGGAWSSLAADEPTHLFADWAGIEQ